MFKRLSKEKRFFKIVTTKCFVKKIFVYCNITNNDITNNDWRCYCEEKENLSDGRIVGSTSLFITTSCTGAKGEAGSDGVNGVDGVDGTDGEDGESIQGEKAQEQQYIEMGYIQVGKSSYDFEQLTYESAVTYLGSVGFTNIELIPLKDLITGWVTTKDTISSITIDSKSSFSASDYFSPSALIIEYHSF